MSRGFAVVGAALAAALVPLAPAYAGLVSAAGPFDTLSAYPMAGAALTTRLGMATTRIPVAWQTALAMGNGGWELGLGSSVVSPYPTSYAAFDNLTPWGRIRLPSLWGVPIVFIAGATIPAATGSNTVAGIGLGASFNWEGDRVDINAGTRLNPADPGTYLQGTAHVAFTHPLGRGLDGVAEIIFQGGTPRTENLMVERLGFKRTFSDNWAGDLAVSLNSPLGGTGSLSVAPSLGLSYMF